MKYKYAEGPTQVDFGDNDYGVVGREVDFNDKKEKFSGWTNPLAWTDGGDDDDQILNMNFKPLDEPYRVVQLPNYTLDEDIKISQFNEVQSVVEVQKA